MVEKHQERERREHVQFPWFFEWFVGNSIQWKAILANVIMNKFPSHVEYQHASPEQSIEAQATI